MRDATMMALPRVLCAFAVTCTCSNALKLPVVRREAAPASAISRRSLPAAALVAAAPSAFAASKRENGLEWEDVKLGEGYGPAKLGGAVTIDYIAWLDGFEGREFSRFDKPIKVELGAGKVVAGLEECLSDGTMNAGGTRRVKIPPSLAYGETGFPRSGDRKGSIIPANASLFFQVRLRTIVLSKGVSGLTLF